MTLEWACRNRSTNYDIHGTACTTVGRVFEPVIHINVVCGSFIDR